MHTTTNTRRRRTDCCLGCGVKCYSRLVQNPQPAQPPCSICRCRCFRCVCWSMNGFKLTNLFFAGIICSKSRTQENQLGFEYCSIRIPSSEHDWNEDFTGLHTLFHMGLSINGGSQSPWGLSLPLQFVEFRARTHRAWETACRALVVYSWLSFIIVISRGLGIVLRMTKFQAGKTADSADI